MKHSISRLQTPNLFVPGAPKSGTTYLANILCTHPEVFIPGEKELHFFCDWKYAEDKRPNYESRFHDRDCDQKLKWWADCSTSYWTQESAASLIQKHYPNSRILILLRDPISQIYSHYWHLRRQNFHCENTEKLNLQEAIQQYPEHLLEPALYSKHLSTWKNYFGSNVKVILFEDLIKGQEKLDQISEFLGLSSTLKSPESLDSRGGVEPKNKLLESVYRSAYRNTTRALIKPVDAIFGWDNFLKYFNRIGARQKLELLFYRKKSSRISDEDASFIVELLRADLNNLPEQLGFQPDCWRSYRMAQNDTS
tara:strand:+ start:3351 stop:4277 length:927 start_codon:yes stop_codon:yes gene_type:complete